MTRIQSFDVFDTVLTRAVGLPTSVFLLMGRRAAQQNLVACTPEVFARSRIEAESRARNNAGTRDVTLKEIYTELGLSLDLSEGALDALMKMECALEAELIQPVPGARQRVEAARRCGKRILFLSDMYLPTAFIRNLLGRYGLLHKGEGCYVSSEEGHGKTNGLFRTVLGKEQVQPDQVVHVGNSMKDDVAAARRSGLSAELFLDANVNRFEAMLEAHAHETEGLASVLAGASRLARLNVPTCTLREASIRDIAASVVGPALTGYVLWVLRRAKALRLRRLYFISRDGQILLEIARRLAARLEIQCELRYLYGGRQAWHLAGLSDVTERDLDWILFKGDFLSIETALVRLDLSPSEIAHELKDTGLSAQQWSRNLTQVERAKLGSLLLHQPRIRALILERAQSRRRLLAAYLRQERFFDEGPIGLLDVGWLGRTCQSVAKATGVHPIAFYIGLQEEAVDQGEQIRECYLFDRRKRQGYDLAIPELPGLIESFCQADHGLVMGYEQAGDGSIRPVLKPDGNRLVMDWGLPIVHETVRQFVDHLVLDATAINIWADARPAIARLLKAFWTAPARAEAIGWAGFPYEDDQAGSYWKPLAVAYGWSAIGEALRSGRVGRRYAWEWRQGSLAISPLFIQAAIARAIRTHAVCDRWVSGLVRVLRLGMMKNAVGKMLGSARR